MEFLPVQEISSCIGHFFSKYMPINVKNYFIWHEISPKLLGQEISYFDKKFLPVQRFFSSCDKKFLPVTRNLFLLQKIFLWPEISYCGKKFLPVAKYFLLRKIYVCDNAWISANISCEPEDFVGAWLPGSRGISHPGAESDTTWQTPCMKIIWDQVI